MPSSLPSSLPSLTMTDANFHGGIALSQAFGVGSVGAFAASFGMPALRRGFSRTRAVFVIGGGLSTVAAYAALRKFLPDAKPAAGGDTPVLVQHAFKQGNNKGLVESAVAAFRSVTVRPQPEGSAFEREFFFDNAPRQGAEE